MCGRIFGVEVSIDILAKMVCFGDWWRVKRVSLQQTEGDRVLRFPLVATLVSYNMVRRLRVATRCYCLNLNNRGATAGYSGAATQGSTAGALANLLGCSQGLVEIESLVFCIN